MFFYSKGTLFIDEYADSFPVFFEVGIRNGDLFFGGNYSVPVNISSSSVGISGSSSRFLLIAWMPNDHFGLNDKARFLVNGKVSLKLFTV